MGFYNAHERKILAKLAEALVPGGTWVPAGGEATVDRFERYINGVPPWVGASTRSAAWAIEAAAIPFAGRPFSMLSVDDRIRVIDRWNALGLSSVRHALRGLTAGLKSVHFDTPEMFARVGAPYGITSTAREETPRWLAQVTDGRELREDQHLECDVVIVGTGAGGAPLAYELARRGHAVLLVEEGKYFRRSDFNGHASEMTRKMYRENGMTIAFGNISAPLWAGVTVGGTTTVNSGTCYRTPERTFRRWREAFGLSMFSTDSMDAYYRKVEAVLGVEHAKPQYVGNVGRIIARGADRLGWVHGPLRRNAPDCDGQGLCCFGCPTGAKRSTDVSYVPMALERGAMLISSAKVETVRVEHGEARGVVAKAAGGATITIDAKMTVLSCGAMMTPVVLQGNKLANSSGMVGKNLSIHPAGAVFALFDERVDMHAAIPQGYAVEQFAEDGMMLEGGSTPLDITGVAMQIHGRRFVEVMERYRDLCAFGFMIQDTSRGRVHRAPGGHPVITYNLNREDAHKMQRCVEAISQIYFAAGATSVFPTVAGFDELRNTSDLARLRAATLSPGDFDVSAYHPLGTARMGTDPRASVVAPDHQTHDVRGLYIVDGSTIPSSLGVNPQMTIMAMALRAAEIMDARLSSQTSGKGDSEPETSSSSGAFA